MQEYVSEALVLDKETTGVLDSRLTLFTRRFGKLTPKAKSARKITSKLSGHLEPGNLVRVRMIEKNGLQVVDALKTSRISIGLSDLYFLSRLLAEAEPEPRLWQELLTGAFSWAETLKILGWDPREAGCELCRGEPHAFGIQSQQFFCKGCVSKLSDKELILVDVRR